MNYLVISPFSSIQFSSLEKAMEYANNCVLTYGSAQVLKINQSSIPQ